MVFTNVLGPLVITFQGQLRPQTSRPGQWLSWLPAHTTSPLNVRSCSNHAQEQGDHTAFSLRVTLDKPAYIGSTRENETVGCVEHPGRDLHIPRPETRGMLTPASVDMNSRPDLHTTPSSHDVSTFMAVIIIVLLQRQWHKMEQRMPWPDP